MKKLEPAVFFPAAMLVVAGVAYAVFAHDQAEFIFNEIRETITDTMGWLYTVGVGAFLVAALIVALSDWGRIKLGPQESEPEYDFLPWFAMLFSAGMGIGLMFFAVAEPINHFALPPDGEAGTLEAARRSMVLTFFHWGVHAWAIYVVVGLSLAYFTYRHGLPLTIRSALFPLIGDRIYGPIGHLVDVLAVIGTLFGVATSLGYGVTQINAGLNDLFGLPISEEVQMALIAIITAMATTSVVAGLDAGIKRLSEWNLYLAIALMLFVFIVGPTVFLLSAFVQNIGDYLDQLAVLTFNIDAYGGGEWIGDWTLFYWGWWISWSPFVGMFIARISRGRTIREFILGVLIGPTLFTFFWMTVYGNSALREVMGNMAHPIVTAVTGGNSELALFAFLDTLPLSGITSVMAIVLVTTFFVTSSDSGSLVKSTLTSGGMLNPPLGQRLFWAISEGVVAAVLLLVGGLAALQSATIAAALPFTIVIILALVGLVRAWSLETARRAGRKTAAQLPIQGASVPWRTRLKLMFTQPNRDEVIAFIQTTVVEAFQEVAEELRGLDVDASVERGEDYAKIVVDHQDQPDFVYSVAYAEYEEPHFPVSDEEAEKDLRYGRAEVALSEGGQHYDVYGYSKNQVIRDLLRQYERHLQWIHHITRAN
ncbi:choline transporter [Marinicauda salina]|uniref:Choline transporter n=1 Tax=Marinicauda salina TaxID=2135793 RepID=A0A2U2BR81_9PROT|nr:BCCT family transporter [Marinicauda salina]PWE16521.1 choline transporter [Marinicauda salina]